MTLIALVWLACPFVLMAVIAQHQGVLALLMRVYPAGVVLGLVGAAAMLLSAFAVHNVVLYFVGAPLCGLAVFSPRRRRDGGDDGGGGGGGGDDDRPKGGEDGPPFDWPELDWPEFERAFWAHVGRTPEPVP